LLGSRLFTSNMRSRVLSTARKPRRVGRTRRGWQREPSTRLHRWAEWASGRGAGGRVLRGNGSHRAAGAVGA